jgi:hypothetical protein
MRFSMNALPRLAKYQKHVLAQFDNPGEYVAYLQEHARQGRKPVYGSSFYSGESFNSACAKAIEGDAKAAEQSAKLMKSLSDLAIPQKRREMVHAKHGGRVSVPAYLGGSQDPVRKTKQIASQKAPIAIVCGFVSSGMIDSADLYKRGTALAALVRRVAAQRPVELYLAGSGRIASTDTSVSLLIKFPTRPIDTHRLAFLLSSQGFGRLLAFAGYDLAHDMAARAGGFADKARESDMSIFWGGNHDYSTSTNCPYAQDVAQVLGKQTFYFNDVISTKGDMTEINQDAVAWVNRKAKELTQA